MQLIKNKLNIDKNSLDSKSAIIFCHDENLAPNLFSKDFKYKTKFFDNSQNPIDFITSTINNHQFTSESKDIHIVSHGSDKGILIGGKIINRDLLATKSELLRTWDLDNIYIWSCEVGNNKTLISLLSDLTGAKVFSSKEKISKEKPYIYGSSGEKINLNKIIENSVIQSWEGALNINWDTFTY